MTVPRRGVPTQSNGPANAEDEVMAKIVFDISMSLDGFIARRTAR